MGRPLHHDAPNLNKVLSSWVPLRTHIPKVAQEAWGRCEPNTNENRSPVTFLQTSMTMRTISTEETSEPRPWRRRANFRRLAPPCSSLLLRISRQGDARPPPTAPEGRRGQKVTPPSPLPVQDAVLSFAPDGRRTFGSPPATHLSFLFPAN